MEGARDQPFAGPGFSQDQNRRLAGSDNRQFIQHAPKGGTFTNNFLKIWLGPGPTFQITLLLLQPAPQFLELAGNSRILDRNGELWSSSSAIGPRKPSRRLSTSTLGKLAVVMIKF